MHKTEVIWLCIEEMNTGYNREDFKSDFDFKYAVTYAFVRDLLIEYIGCGFTDRETQTLFEIYCAMWFLNIHFQNERGWIHGKKLCR